jgi:CHAT domain-containing protein/tetratricopeptide (TPR) repeat protein
MVMDEQRFGAYSGLIQALLSCPQGQEMALLQENAALVDAGLLEVMGLVAGQMEAAGDNNAGWLRQFAGQLGRSLGQEEASSGVAEDVEQFVGEVIQQIAQTGGNPAQVYGFWKNHLARFNQDFLATLPATFRRLTGQNKPELIASIFTFGNLIAQFPLGTRWLNLEMAIAAYERALEVCTREAFPEDWATTQNNLANVYSKRIRGERADNLEQAIAAYERALEVRTRKAFSEDWAMTQNNLAAAYRNRIRGERADNLEQAISAYEQALEVYTREAFPEQWATTQNNLATAYCDRIRGERADNLEQVIAASERALEVFTHSKLPEQWATTQNNLVIAYSNRIRGERADNLELAIAASKRVLRVFTHSKFPEQWAMTQNNLAAAYSERIRGERADNLELAISAYERALEVYTRNAFPEQWAMMQNNLANVYSNRIRGERADNLELAITASKQVMEVFTREAYPEQWATTQNNLANAYRDRIRGERADNLERAISAYEQALEVRTRNAFPEQWAMTQNNLANAYGNRIRRERADNLELAITAYERALEVYTREAFPKDWAMTQNNLATAYSNRIRGERADNLELAISACERALEVRTRETFPEDWATTQNNLAIAYSERIRGERADNLELAISAYERALEVRTRNAFPEAWAMTQNNLATAYNNRIRGERADNLERAISAYEQVLEVRTYEAFPEDWAMTQNNLATAYSNRIRGERADNLELAITTCERAMEVYTRKAFPERWAMTQNNLATTYSDRIRGERADNLERAIAAYKGALEVLTREAFPNGCRRISRSLGNLQSEQQNWEAAAQAYTQALATAEDLYQACTLLDSQAGELKETADLPRRAAYAYAKIGQLDRAVATIERGRARGLSETLNRDRADLQQLQQQRPDLYNQYRDITNQLRNLESQQRNQQILDRQALTLEQHRNAAQQLRQQLTDAIAQIRQVPGYETFLKPSEFSDIQRQLPSDRPIVYLITTPNGSLALIVTPDHLDQFWLNEFNETQLTEQVNTWLNAYRQSQADRQSWYNTIATVTGKLWEPLMSPLIDRLKQTGHDRATLIPTGYLSLLPLHAAWTPDPAKPTGKRYALDEINFTYAPNAQSLIAARQIAEQFPKIDSILAIDDPTKNNPDIPVLRYSTDEINTAIASFPNSQVFRHNSATVEAIRQALPNHPIVHFSCHGTAKLNEPLNSGLIMHDELLSLADLFELKLTDTEQGGIRLAVLSACETGLSGIELADEAIGLPIGMMQAGVAAVVASLWSVSDLSTSLLLRKFYQLWRNDKLEPSEALRQAQIWLRDSNNSEISKIYPDYQTYLDEDDRDFQQPFYWSAFSYLGI